MEGRRGVEAQPRGRDSIQDGESRSDGRQLEQAAFGRHGARRRLGGLDGVCGQSRLARLRPAEQREESGRILTRAKSRQPALEALQRSGLVLRRDLHSADWFTFKHALVQNAAYESMLRSRRRDLHARIAMALELQPNVVEAQPELLARHRDLAGLVENAIDAYLRAGERATSGSHHAEALAHYRRVLELLSTLPASRKRSARELDVHTALRNALVVLRGYSSPEVEEACVVALALCDELGTTEQLFPVLWSLAGFHMVRGDHTSCAAINTRLLEIATTSGNRDLALLAHDTVGQTLYYQGAFEEALGHFSRATQSTRQSSPTGEEASSSAAQRAGER